MKKNLGNLDRLIRLLIALVIIPLYFMNVISGAIALIALALSAILMLTSVIRYCPLYKLFGISTVKAKH